MIFNYGDRMSRLKKKLLLYFILISIVSVSVSSEIILELGSSSFKNSFVQTLEKELVKDLGQEKSDRILSEIDHSALFHPIVDLQVRMILLLLVVGGSIVGAFFLFTKDIVSPMENMVSATKKIAEGDLSASVPVQSEDEIGQIGNLINEMSVNLQDLILQLRSEVDRMRERITVISNRIHSSFQGTDLKQALEEKKINASDIRNLISAGDDMNGMLNDMLIDLSALQAFVNLYKVFEVKEEEKEEVQTPE